MQNYELRRSKGRIWKGDIRNITNPEAANTDVIVRGNYNITASFFPVYN